MSWLVICQCCTVSVRKVKVLTFSQVHVKSLKWEMIKEADRKEEEQKILTDMSFFIQFDSAATTKNVTMLVYL